MLTFYSYNLLLYLYLKQGCIDGISWSPITSTLYPCNYGQTNERTDKDGQINADGRTEGRIHVPI